MEKEDLIDIIFCKITEAEKFYRQMYPKIPIESTCRPTAGEKTISQNKNIREHQDLKAFNYNLSTIHRKEEEKIKLRFMKKNKEKIFHIIEDPSEIDKLDKVDVSWNKMDNWQKRMKLKEHIISLKNPLETDLLRLSNDLLKKNEFKKNGLNLVYNQDSKLIEKIIHPEFQEILGTVVGSPQSCSTGSTTTT